MSSSVRLALALLLGLEARAHGLEAETPAERVVEIRVDGDAAAVSETREASATLFTSLFLTPVIVAEDDPNPSANSEVFLRAYVDLRTHAPRIVVVDGKSAREIARRTLPESASLETSVEAATQVLYMLVEATLEAGSAPSAASHEGPPRASTMAWRPVTPKLGAAATPQPVRPVEARATEPVELDAGALVKTFHSTGMPLLPGAGALLDVRGRASRQRWALSLLFAAHGSTSLPFGEASVTLTPFSARLAPELEFDLLSNLTLWSGLSVGFDWFNLSSQHAPAPAIANDTGAVVDFTFGALFGTRVRVASHWLLTAGAGLDVDPAPHAFVVEVGGQRQPLLELAHVRPLILVAASYSFALPVGKAPAATNPTGS